VHAHTLLLLLLLLRHRSFISDITTQQCRQLLKREANGSLFDVVVHDGAPNVGGAWASEAYTQVRLLSAHSGRQSSTSETLISTDSCSCVEAFFMRCLQQSTKHGS
jgi:hypothetical protein